MSDLLLISSVAESEAVKRLVVELDREVEEIDKFLITANSKKLPEFDRDVLLATKAVYLRVMSYFDTSRLKVLEKEIDNNLHNVV